MAAPTPLPPLWYLKTQLAVTDKYPSALEWITKTGWHEQGDMAGRFVPQTRYYVLSLGGAAFTAHRIVYYLLTGDNPGMARVHHLSTDRDNRRGLSLVAKPKPFVVLDDSSTETVKTSKAIQVISLVS